MSGTFTYVSPSVPEPSTWAMMLLGFGAVGFAIRRRRSPKLAASWRSEPVRNFLTSLRLWTGRCASLLSGQLTMGPVVFDDTSGSAGPNPLLVPDALRPLDA